MDLPLMPDTLDDDRAVDVLEVLKEQGRVNPLLVREETGLDKGDVNTVLVQLCRDGYARRVTRGLYEFVHDPREDTAGDG